jgi:subfamily B ATP-binding cassette protein MsbA
MKIYFKLVTFAQNIWRYIVPYLVFTTLGTVFSLINFSLLIPVLNILFKPDNQAKTYLESPNFNFSTEYFIHLFYYNLNQMVQLYGKIGALQFVCIILIFTVLLSNLFRYLGVRTIESLRTDTIQIIRQKMFDKITSFHLGFFSEQRKGDLMAKMTTDIYELEYSITQSLFSLFKEVIAMVIFFVALFRISFQLTIFTLIIIPTTGVIIALIVRGLKRYAGKTQDSISLTTSILDETISGLKIIKAFNALPYIRQKFHKETQRYADDSLKMAKIREISSPISEFMGVVTVVFILLYGGSLVLSRDGSLEAEAFITYIAIFSQIINPAKSITVSISNIQRGIVCGERILQVLEMQPDIQDKPQAIELQQFKDSIEFKNVYFKYGQDWVLKDVSFKLEKGKTLALVGASGGGKSTITNLLPRFYDINEGQILIDGIDIRDYTSDSLLRQIGMVSQESILFNDTVFNNIAFGQPNASLESVMAAAKIAHAHEYILQTEKGYQTNIGDRGMKLSGGQQQRLSIARAVFKNAPILILDEATSSLDSNIEKLVQEAFNTLMQNRTSLVVAHRLSTIQNADLILVLDKGQIVERGTHSELIGLENGLYRKLIQIQSLAIA